MIRAWRIKYREPDPREFVSIQFVRTGGEAPVLTPPWILSIEDAQSLFGKAVIDCLSDQSREIKLKMEIGRFEEEAGE
jgi:hypothetical protein